MSLKTVELQVALPRTIDNSRNVQTQQHQNSLQGAMGSEEMTAQTERMEETVADAKESARAEEDRKRRGRQAGPEHKRETASAASAAEDPAPHPYKGHLLDIKM